MVRNSGVWLIKVIAIALPLLVSPGPAASAAESQFDKCVGSTDTNSGWANCGNAEIARQEKRLNAAWEKALRCFDPQYSMQASKEELIFDQRLWGKWKDAACGLFLNGGLGREPQVINGPLCKIKIISDRAEWLEELSKDFYVCGEQK